MNFILQPIHNFWIGLNHLSAAVFGAACGFGTSLLPGLIFNNNAAFIGLWFYFPFNAWLLIQMFLVVLSPLEREKRLGKGYGFVGAFFSILFARKYGLFCLSCFYSIVFSWLILGIG
ncbi:MAG: hypothetical protein AAGF28_12010 [Pseudomonadota bacterium]